MSLGAPLRFLYENGKAFGFLVDEATAYFYIKNLHGDVVQIVDENGNTMVTYSYDSWGNELSATGDETLLALNPFTYRGYQYDRETGLYYLQARYYNPQWGRFINADTNLDTQASVIGTNIFAYCDNNPVMRTDSSGKRSFSDEEKDAFMCLIVALAGILTSGIIALISGMDKISFSFSKDKTFNIYGTVTHARTDKWYLHEQYSIVTYGAKVSDWWKYIDKVRQAISAYNATGVFQFFGDGLALFGKGIKLTGAGAFAALASQVVMAEYVTALSATIDLIETNMRGMKGTDFYFFNWSIVYVSKPFYGPESSNIIYAYSWLATLC